MNLKLCKPFIKIGLCAALIFSHTLYAETLTVQVGAFGSPNAATIALAKQIEHGTLYGSINNKLHKYYIGRHESRETAIVKLALIRDKGFPDAFLANYSDNFEPVENVQTKLNQSTASETAPAAEKPVLANGSFMRSPIVDDLSVEQIEAILANLPQSDQTKVVIMEGKLWIKENEQLKPLPLS